MMTFLLVTALSTTLAAEGTDKVLDQVQAVYRDAGDLTASFQQVYVDKVRGKKRSESGKLWAKQDGRVRWTYQQPQRKDFVFDGTTAYFYEPENAQVTVFERFEDSQLSTAMRFLWGQGELKKSFAVRPCSAKCDLGQPGDITVELVPREPVAAVDHVLLVVDSKTHRVKQSVVFDPLGNRTEYHFNDVQFGAKIDPGKFSFTVPTGVSVLRATSDPGASAGRPKAP